MLLRFAKANPRRFCWQKLFSDLFEQSPGGRCAWRDALFLRLPLRTLESTFSNLTSGFVQQKSLRTAQTATCYVLRAGFAKQDVWFLVSSVLSGLIGYVVSVTSCLLRRVLQYLEGVTQAVRRSLVLIVAAERSGALLCCVASPLSQIRVGLNGASLSSGSSIPLQINSSHQTVFSSFLFWPWELLYVETEPSSMFFAYFTSLSICSDLVLWVRSFLCAFSIASRALSLSLSFFLSPFLSLFLSLSLSLSLSLYPPLCLLSVSLTCLLFC